MKWRGLLDNRECGHIDLGFGVVMYSVNRGSHCLPEHIKNYLNNIDYQHYTIDRYVGSVRDRKESYLVDVPAGMQSDKMIVLSSVHLKFVTGNLYIIVGSGASVSFVYDQFLSIAIVMHLEPYAKLCWNHSNEHHSDNGSTHITCYQQHDSQLMFNGRYTRTIDSTMFFVLREPKAHAQVALSLHLQEAHQASFNTTQIHQASQTVSDLVLKGLLASASRSVHRGMIHIEKNAQQSDAQLMSRYLLLHHEAEAYAVPSLEVLTNDVICAHGSSVGSCDDAHLFYLMSRGIALHICYQLLSDAFLDSTWR